MTRLLAPALALLLSGCGMFGGSTAALPPERERPEVAACRQDARASAAALDFGREVNMSNMTQRDRIERRRADAERAAFNDCLRRRGLSRGGGVEAVRRDDPVF